MDPQNNIRDNQKEEKNRKRREAYQRGKVSAALLTDEQREEKNRKAYKRKKCHAHNKENKPVDLNTSNPITNASDVCVISEMAEHTSGICSYVIFLSSYAIFPCHETNSTCLQVLLCSIVEVIIF